MEDKSLKDRINQVRKLETLYFGEASVNRFCERAFRAYIAWVDSAIQLLSYYYPEENETLKTLKYENRFGKGDEMLDLFYQIRTRVSSMLIEIESGRMKPLTTNPTKPKRIVESDTTNPLVFISHASKDKDIIQEFNDNILKIGLGLSDANLVCTSFEWTTAPLGEDITEYIQEKIEKANVVLAMVSQEYKKSEVCQNEVGAAWALGKRIISIVLPDADFKQLGWLFNLDKAIKIEDENSLNHLQKDLCDCLTLQPKIPLHWKPCVSQFLKRINSQKPIDTTF